MRHVTHRHSSRHMHGWCVLHPMLESVIHINSRESKLVIVHDVGWPCVLEESHRITSPRQRLLGVRLRSLVSRHGRCMVLRAPMQPQEGHAARYGISTTPSRIWSASLLVMERRRCRFCANSGSGFPALARGWLAFPGSVWVTCRQARRYFWAPAEKRRASRLALVRSHCRWFYQQNTP